MKLYILGFCVLFSACSMQVEIGKRNDDSETKQMAEAIASDKKRIDEIVTYLKQQASKATTDTPATKQP